MSAEVSGQTWTVEQALRLLGHGKAWHPTDLAIGAALCAQISVGRPLGDDQRRRAHRLLAGYETELAKLGVPYAAIGVPAEGYARAQAAAVKTAAAVPSPATVTRVHFDASKDRLIVKAPYALLAKMRELPVCTWNKSLTAYVAPATPASAHAIHDALSTTGLQGDEPFTRLLLKSREQRKAGLYRTRDDLPPIPGSKTDAWTHQRQAFYFARELEAAQLDCEMGTGKAQPLSAGVLTPTGWTTMGALQPGDAVIGADGLATKVLAVHERGERPAVCVTLSDGRSTICCLDHLWTVQTSIGRNRGATPRTLSTRELLARGVRTPQGNRRWFLPPLPPVQFDPAPPLPVAPYVLGVLIGDGGLTGGGVTFTKPDPHVVERVRADATAMGLQVRTYREDLMFGLVTDRGQPNPLLDQMRAWGLMVGSHERFIPPEYLTASVSDRLTLLQGLCDTDGSADGRSVDLHTSSHRLAVDLAELVRGLGGTISVRHRGTAYRDQDGQRIECRVRWRCRIVLPADQQPFSLPRKRDRLQPPQHSVAVAVESIEPVASSLMRCITVEATDGLYVTDQYVVTHNSKIVVDLIADSGADKAMIVCPERVVGVWPKQFRIHSGREVHVVDPRRETRNGEWKLIPIATRVELYEHALYECGCGLPHILVSNYAAAGHEPFKSWSTRQRFDFLAYDEALALDTELPTPTGWVRLADVEVGDELFGSDGHPTTVLGLTPIAESRPCYRVTFNDGTSLVADAGHLWWARPQQRGGTRYLQHRVVTTEDLFKSDRRWALPRNGATQTPPVPLPLDPYVLGTWLGNGTVGQQYVTVRRDLLDASLEAFRATGCSPQPVASGSTDAVVRVGLGGDVARVLRDMGVLHRKSVPAVYLRGSVEQRLALIQGLMDTDGHLNAKSLSAEFSNTNEQIIDSMVELLRSVGYGPHKHRTTDVRVGVKGEHSPCWKVGWSPRADRPVFRLRMHPLALTDVPSRHVRVESVEPAPSVPVRCVKVAAPDSLFLAGRGFTVTHNSHRLRTASGVWSRWAAKMQKRAARRLGGTGTLQAQTPLDVFGQFRALDPGIFGNSETSFKHRYAIFGGFNGHEMKGMNPATENELAEKISSITYRAGAEVLDLPAEIPDVTLTCNLSPKAMKVYKEFENELYAEVSGFLNLTGGLPNEDVLEASAPNVLVKILRCMQMTGGLLRTDQGVDVEIDTSKADLLREDLEDIPEREPVVVFAKFIHDLDSIERVAAKLGRPYAELSGRRADALSRDATLAEHCVIAGVQLQAGGTGVDFTRSAFATYYSMGHSLSDYLQSRKRLVRPGQERSVRFRHLVAEGTIDEDVYAALAARESVTARLSDKVRRLQQEGTL